MQEQTNTATLETALSTQAASEYAEPQAPTAQPVPASIVAVTKLMVEDRVKAFAAVNKNMTRVRKLLNTLTVEGITPTLALDSEGHKLIIQGGDVIGKGQTNAEAFVKATADIPTDDLIRIVGPTLVAMLLADKLIGPFTADNRRNRRALGIPTKENEKKMKIAAEAAKRQAAQALVDETNVESTEELAGTDDKTTVVEPTDRPVEPEGIPTGALTGNEYAGEGADASEAEATA